jgi:triacylglycerol lipase
MLKPLTKPSLAFTLHPELDTGYRHFENAAQHPFEAAAQTMTRLNAWWLAEAALLAYWPTDAAVPIFQGAGLQAQRLDAGTTNCYLAWGDAFVMVAFRGTQPNQWGDVLDDLKFPPLAWSSGTVHGGFHDAFSRIRPALEGRLQALAPSRSVWFSGHSLGAALAILAADWWPGTRGVCTLGAPRVGDPAFAAAFDAKFAGRSWRYVNDNDIVPHLPPPLFGPFLYDHVVAPRFIAPKGGVSAAAPRLASYFAELIGSISFVSQLFASLDKGLVRVAPEFVLDHMASAYTAAIWNDYAAHR